MATDAGALQFVRLWRCAGGPILQERMDHKTADGDADAGVGDIKGGPGMSQRHVEIEEEEIDDVPMQQAVGQVTKHAGQQQREGDIAPSVGRMSPNEECGDDDEGGAGKDDEEEVVIPEGTEGGASVGDEDEGEDVRDNDARLFREDVPEDEPFGDLIERVKRQAKEEEFHVRRRGRLR